jgi:hypothetical protein
MSVFEMVAIIVTVSVLGGIITKYLEMKKGGAGSEVAKQLKAQGAELEALKKRIRNLETIMATEPEPKSLELEDEIISYDDKLENQLSKIKKRTR